MPHTLLDYLDKTFIDNELKYLNSSDLAIIRIILQSTISHNNVLSKTNCYHQAKDWRENLERNGVIKNAYFEILTASADLFFHGDYTSLQNNIYAEVLSKILKTLNVSETLNETDHIIIKELLSSAFALRLLVETRRHNLELPYDVFSQKELESDFRQLKAKKTGDLDKASPWSVGKKCSTYYMQEHMAKVSVDMHPSIYRIFHDDNLLFSRIRSVIKEQVTEKKEILFARNPLKKYFKFNSLTTNFNPSITLNLLYTLRQKDKHFPITSVADFCGGFGGRLTAFLADPEIDTIVSNDVNKDLEDSYNKIVELHKATGGKNKEIKFLFRRAEYLTSEEIQYNHKRHDLIHTSPPYFTKEIYSTAPGQSSEEFKDLDGWMNGFLKPAVWQAFTGGIKLQGYFAISLGTAYYKKKMFNLADLFTDFIKTTFYCNTHFYPLGTNKRSSNNNGIIVGRFGNMIVSPNTLYVSPHPGANPNPHVNPGNQNTRYEPIRANETTHSAIVDKKSKEGTARTMERPGQSTTRDSHYMSTANHLSSLALPLGPVVTGRQFFFRDHRPVPKGLYIYYQLINYRSAYATCLMGKDGFYERIFTKPELLKCEKNQDFPFFWEARPGTCAPELVFFYLNNNIVAFTTPVIFNRKEKRYKALLGREQITVNHVLKTDLFPDQSVAIPHASQKNSAPFPAFFTQSQQRQPTSGPQAEYQGFALGANDLVLQPATRPFVDSGWENDEEYLPPSSGAVYTKIKDLAGPNINRPLPGGASIHQSWMPCTPENQARMHSPLVLSDMQEFSDASFFDDDSVSLPPRAPTPLILSPEPYEWPESTSQMLSPKQLEIPDCSDFMVGDSGPLDNTEADKNVPAAPPSRDNSSNGDKAIYSSPTSRNFSLRLFDKPSSSGHQNDDDIYQAKRKCDWNVPL